MDASRARPQAGVANAIRSFSTLVAIGLGAVLIVALVTVLTLRINGPLYDRIVLGKDLVADVLPPPEYVIEAYLEATLALNDPASVEARTGRLKQLKADYDDRHAYWAKSHLTPSLKPMILQASHEPAEAFWTELEQTFLPALRAGNSEGARASYGRLAADYARHRAAVDSLVAATNIENSRTESLALAVLIGLSLVGAAVTGGVIVAVRRRARRIAHEVVTPLGQLTETMTALASGALDRGIPSSGRGDEIGEMARALEVLRDSARDAGRLRQEQEKASAEREEDRRHAERLRAESLSAMASRIEQQLGAGVQVVAEAMGAVAERAGEMARAASAIETDSEGVAGAASDAMRSAKDAEAAADELDAAISGINAQVGEARQATADTAGATREAEVTLARLSSAIQEIDTVTALISDIARQTSLLAINASVEAARAGTAGQGFAVVANEVKSLSGQTAVATGQIGQLIAAVQDSAAAAVDAVQAIAGRVESLDAASVAIAAAVDRQTIATREIVGSLAQASSAAQAVAAGIEQVAGEVRGAGDHSRAVDALSRDVAANVEDLRTSLMQVVRSSTEHTPVAGPRSGERPAPGLAA
jgi:methyl-accepting chemotaxis protein